MTAMGAVLRRHGATMVERHGRAVAAHFGSAATEAAVCTSHVGLAERPERATLELRGPEGEVDNALAELAFLRERVGCKRCTPRRAILTCEETDTDTCTSAMLRCEDVAVSDISADHVVVDLIGPFAEDVLRASEIEREEGPALVMRRVFQHVELVVPAAQGPALWNRLLEAGEPFGIGCVGVEAVEHLAVSARLSGRRHPAVRDAKRHPA